MPLANEIHLGYVGIDRVMQKLGEMRMEIPSDPQAFLHDFGDITFPETVQEGLDKALISVIEELPGWEYKEKTTGHFPHHKFTTPWGERETSGFNLYIRYDPVETDRTVEDMTLSIGLSSRYFPCILDAEDEHGTIGPSFSIAKAMEKMLLCKKEITKVLPFFWDAEFIVREIWY